MLVCVLSDILFAVYFFLVWREISTTVQPITVKFCADRRPSPLFGAVSSQDVPKIINFRPLKANI